MTSPCAYCATIFTNRDTFWTTPEIGSSYEPVLYRRRRWSLADTADKGCSLCLLLQRHDMRVMESTPMFGHSRRSYLVGLEEALNDDILFAFRLRQATGNSLPRAIRITIHDNVFGGELVLSMASDADNPLSRHVSTVKNPSVTGTRASFRRIRSWITNCNKNHSDCIGSQRLPPLLPTRVLEIGDAPDELHLTLTEGARGHYAAMSYAWGKVLPEPITTTSQTLIKHLHGFSISDLPPSLRDGVLTVRSVGLRYLWIDSICILQDSIEDKEAEMANMQHIYQNAYLTVVAACASSSAESFLNIRDAHSSVITLPAFCFDPDSSSPDRIREDGSIQLWHKNSWQGREPLYERAWTLQETFLAPRLLIYSRDCCFFKCLGGHQCDDPAIDWNTYCAKAGLNSSRMMHGGKLKRPSLSLQAPGIISIINSTSMQANRLPEHFRAWKRIVRDYSMRDLSDPMDKLPALSGIVSYMQNEMEDEYLAGLWRRHLLREVTWMSKGATRPKAWRAPSWSWMSLDGPLSWQADDCDWYEAEASVVSCEVRPLLSYAPFSRIASAELYLMGYLRPNVPDLRRRYPFARPDDHLLEGLYGEIYLDANMVNPERRDSDVTSSGSLSSVPSTPSEHGIYWVFLFARCFTPNHPRDQIERVSTSDQTAWGLALSRRGGEVFERVGYFLAREGCIPWFKNEEQRTIKLV